MSSQEHTPAQVKCQLCAYLRHGGPVGHLPQCTDNEACADAANRGGACPCQQGEQR